MNAKFQTVLAEIEDHFSKYRLSDALMAIYKLINGRFFCMVTRNCKARVSATN